MPTPTGYVKAYIVLPTDMVKQLKELAVREHRSLSKQVSYMLAQILNPTESNYEDENSTEQG